jgi:hypothetical protein
MGGASSDIECVRRVNRTVELLLYIVLSRNRRAQKMKILCVGNIAMSCGSLLSRRLTALGFCVDQATCKQPAALARVEFNSHLNGTDPKYVFCGPKVLGWFRRMIEEHTSRAEAKESSILGLLCSTMATQKLNPMTKSILEEIALDMKSVCEHLSVESKQINNHKDAQEVVKNLEAQTMEVAKSVNALTNLLIGDAYTYKVIVEARASQVPIASREQHMAASLDFGSKVESVGCNALEFLSLRYSCTLSSHLQ